MSEQEGFEPSDHGRNHEDRTCIECGQRYSAEDASEQYFAGPWDYDSGYQKYCLACWLGVGPNDLAFNADSGTASH